MKWDIPLHHVSFFHFANRCIGWQCLRTRMRTIITVGEAKWDISHPNKMPWLEPLQKKLFELFKPWGPKPNTDAHGTYGYPTFEISSSPDDANLKAALREFTSAVKKAKAAAVIWRHPAGPEVEQARFLQPFFLGNYVDEEGFRTLLNPQMEACAECRYPKFDSTPDPFLVGADALKKFDVFSTEVGRLVVSERALEILKREAADVFTFGKAKLGGKAARKTSEPLYWVKPKSSLGQRTRVIAGTKTCQACRRTVNEWLGMLDAQVKRLGPGLFDASFRVQSYNGVTADIAVVDESATGRWPTIVMSGRLLATLKREGIKGIFATARNLAECVFSDADEPALRASASDATSKSATVTAKPKRATTFAAAPWDCAKDGYVYFELSGPEFIVFDPMTGEQNDGGPFNVKKFAGPGLYRAPVATIKAARSGKRAVAVDSATLVFVDNQAAADLLGELNWNSACGAKGLKESYLNELAAKIGSRFGVCTPPPKKFKSEFRGDGMYTIDSSKIVRHPLE